MMRLSQEMHFLLDNIINSLVKWDLVIYIHKIPNDRISADEIACAIARSAEEVMAALAELAACRVLEYEYDGEAIYYRFCPDKELEMQINRFVDCSVNRNTRWLILNYLIESNGFKQVG